MLTMVTFMLMLSSKNRFTQGVLALVVSVVYPLAFWNTKFWLGVLIYLLFVSGILVFYFVASVGPQMSISKPMLSILVLMSFAVFGSGYDEVILSITGWLIAMCNVFVVMCLAGIILLGGKPEIVPKF